MKWARSVEKALQEARALAVIQQYMGSFQIAYVNRFTGLGKIDRLNYA